MKYTYSFILSLLFLTASLAQETNRPYSFEQYSIDLGEITKGDKITDTFNLVNNSSEALEIELVSSCECTSVRWPRKPIQPGEKAAIKFTFDSSIKEVEETIDIDVYFKNTDPKTGEAYFEILNYTYRFK